MYTYTKLEKISFSTFHYKTEQQQKTELIYLVPIDHVLQHF